MLRLDFLFSVENCYSIFFNENIALFRQNDNTVVILNVF